MIEIQFAVIVLLIAMTLILSRYYNTRFRALEDKMKDVADFQQSVKELAEAVQDLKEAVKSEKTVQPQPTQPEKQELTTRRPCRPASAGCRSGPADDRRIRREPGHSGRGAFG